MNQNCIDTALLGEICDDCHGSAIMKLLVLAIQILSGLVVVLAVVGVIICGYQVLTSSGDVNKLSKAKKRLSNIVIGLVAYAVMFIALDFLIPGGIMFDITESSEGCPVLPEHTDPSYPTSSGGTTPSSPSGGGTTPSDTNFDASNILDGYSPATTNPGGTKKVSLLGTTWNMVNTKFDVQEYMRSLNKRNVAQDSKDCYDSGSCVSSNRDNDTCLSFAYTFAYDLVHGTTTCDHCASQYKRSGFKAIQTKDKEAFLSILYDQLTHGWPTVIQVKYSTGTGRHFVVAVGIDASVKSRADFTEKDILLLNTDGSLRHAGQSGSLIRSSGSTGSSKSSLDVYYKSSYGYYILPLKNPNPDAKASNIKSC